MSQRVLVVEDEAKIAGLIAKNLEAIGLVCGIAADGRVALEQFQKETPDLVILDLMLPQIDGLEVCRRIRTDSRVPILMLTARRDEADVVLGLEVGADDYLTKPFGIRELVARVRALLRRAQPDETGEVHVGGLIVDPARRKTSLDGNEIELTTLEFDLLLFLAKRPGRVFTREQLLEHVWGRDRYVDVRSIDSLVSRLRRKIEPDHHSTRLLQTVWGAGYRLAEDP
jgi:two-component system, OmpR family, response regulator MtrA